jgi:hypothetical protein
MGDVTGHVSRTTRYRLTVKEARRKKQSERAKVLTE